MNQKYEEQKNRPAAMLKLIDDLEYLTPEQSALFKQTIDGEFLPYLDYLLPYRGKFSAQLECDLFCMGIVVVAIAMHEDKIPELQQAIHYADLLSHRDKTVNNRRPFINHDAILILILSAGLAYINGEIWPDVDLSANLFNALGATKKPSDTLIPYGEVKTIQADYRNQELKLVSETLNDRIAGGYHSIEMSFNAALSMMASSGETLKIAIRNHIVDLKKITLENYTQRKENFTSENCRAIAIDISGIIHRLEHETINECHLELFKSSINKYRSCSKFTQIAMHLLGALSVCLAAVAVCVATGASAVTLPVGVIGAGIGYKLAGHYTLWANHKVYEKNKNFVDCADHLGSALESQIMKKR